MTSPSSSPTPLDTYRVFGYGSLIFKANARLKATTYHSNDHRGTPEDPGRVVTLISIDDWNHFSENDAFPHDDIVWGVVYTIDPDFAAEVKAYLGFQNGYTETTVDVWNIVDGKESVVESKVTVYVGRPDNPAFVGSEPYDQLARHIWSHSGPSGQNKDYLYNLADAIRKLAPESHDSHLVALEERVRALDSATEVELHGA
ncbi:ChaC-like protein [Clavulina sp. PMI_390]|nr:ChaC-like protein [Clavulina sp. PMI_390]